MNLITSIIIPVVIIISVILAIVLPIKHHEKKKKLRLQTQPTQIQTNINGYCTKCGTLISEWIVYCQNCGNKIYLFFFIFWFNLIQIEWESWQKIK